MIISIAINIYVDTDEAAQNIFDHPTGLNSFREKTTFPDTFNSIEGLSVPKEVSRLNVFLFAIAANEDTSHDSLIKLEVAKIVSCSKHNYFVITNSDLKKFSCIDFPDFTPSSKGYCEIRNLGFICANISNSKYLIQFDDDEIIPSDYLVNLLRIYWKYPEIYCLNGLYQKDGKFLVDESCDLKCWNKNHSMNLDIGTYLKNPIPIDSIFGLGGNMTFRREFFSKICYPRRITRGEDFALLLCARLIYICGNKYVDIEANDSVFKSFFTGDKSLSIRHKPPVSAFKKHSLRNDLERFIVQKYLLESSGVEILNIKSLSTYIHNMLNVEDFLNLAVNIYNESLQRKKSLYTKNFIDSELNYLKRVIEEVKNNNLFNEYLVYQASYIKYLNKLKLNLSIFSV